MSIFTSAQQKDPPVRRKIDQAIKEHIRDWVQILRLALGAIAAIASCVTLYALKPASSLHQYFLTAGILVCTTSAAFAINDYWDIDKDCINHPERPLPLGHLAPASVKRLASSLFATAFFLAIPLGKYPLLLVTISILLLWYYSAILKFSGIMGNVLVASLVSALLLLSALVTSRLLAVLYPMSFLFCFILAKEIIWDVHDAIGDRTQGIITIASLWGDRAAFQIAWSLLFLLLLSIPIAVVCLPMRYPACFTIGSLVLLTSFSTALVRYQQQRNANAYASLILWSRVGLLFGLLGLLGTMPPL